MKPEKRKIVFWGAGKIGKRLCYFLESIGVRPDFFTDNGTYRWGEIYCGVKIIPPAEAFILENPVFLIACTAVKEIRELLLKNGIPENSIFAHENIYDIIPFLRNISARKYSDDMQTAQEIFRTVLFDFTNGLVLGGVETWSFQMAEQLQKKGISAVCLTNDLQKHTIRNEIMPVIELPYSSTDSVYVRIKFTVNAVCQHLPCTVVCNFPGINLVTACMVKCMYPEKVRIIAVVHNDEDVYYTAYQQVRECIDKCFVISSKIKQVMASGGFPGDRMELLQWETQLDPFLKRTYSETETPIRLGYAGRIVREVKRMDLLLHAADLLYKKGCRFLLEIAGDGTYRDIMQQKIRKLGLEGFVRLVGYLDREQIAAFWKRQDVMVSCSEHEGHSISQVEAMAWGAVPVLTDTSGARDDVEDGYNGYVVDIGDIEKMVNIIIFLDKNREMLPQVGRRAYETIKKRQQKSHSANMLVQE